MANPFDAPEMQAASTNPFDAPEMTQQRIHNYGLQEAIVNGMSFGMAPKIMSAMSAPLQYGVQAAQEALGSKGLPPHQSVADFYGENLNNIRSDQAEYEKKHPIRSTAASLFGGLLDFNPSSVGTAAAQGLRHLVGQGIKMGIPLGAIPAFVNQDLTGDPTDLKSWGNKAVAGGVGGTVGGIVGGTVPAALGVAPALVRTVARPFMKEGADEIAGNVLNKMAGSGGVTTQTPPLPGLQLTTGQLSNNPGVLSLERTMQQRNAAGGGNAMMDEAQRAAANNALITGTVKQLGDVNADASKVLQERLERAYGVARKSNKELWTAADTENTGGVSGHQFNNFMNNHIGTLSIADRSAIPADIMDVMEKMGKEKTQNLSDVQSVRSMLGSKARMAARSGDSNTARVLNGLQDKVEEFIDQRANALGDTLPKYNEARADTAWMKQTFNQPPVIRDVLGVDRFGADKIPTSAVADKFITTGRGGKEALDAYFQATGYEKPAMQAMRDAFAKKFLDHIQLSTSDIGGGRNLSAAATTNFVDDYAHIINSKIFTPQQRELIGKIQQATDMIARTSRAAPKGGSDTAAKLLGNNFLDVMIGPGASKLAPIAGAAIGMSHGPVGMLVGAAAGKGVEKGLTEALYAAPREKVIELLNQAIADPAIAQALMTKASAANAKMMPSAARQKIISILGMEGAAGGGKQAPELWQHRKQYLPAQVSP